MRAIVVVVVGLVVGLAIACSSKESTPAAGSGSGSGSAGSAYDALGKKPANARRPTPPPEIDKKALAVGAKAPAVSLKDATTDASWVLADAVAKRGVMIMFYRGDWCPHCRKQLGELHSKLAELGQRELDLVAISVDAPAAGKLLREKLGLGFPLLSDPGGTAAMKPFGIFDEENEIAWPSIFVVGRDGTIVHRWLADAFDQRIATADVLKALAIK